MGIALGKRLAQSGHVVFGLRRRPRELRDSIHPVCGDLIQPKSLTGLPKDIHCLVYAAAADGGNETDYSNAYVHGPRNLMTVLAAANPLERIIFLSSTRVFAQNNGEWVDEISPTQPTDFRGNTLLAGEKLMLEQNVRAVVLRLGGIYGAGRGSLARFIICSICHHRPRSISALMTHQRHNVRSWIGSPQSSRFSGQPASHRTLRARPQTNAVLIAY